MINDYNADNHSRTIAAFFDTRGSADQAVSDLVTAGISREDVTVTGSDTASAGTADRGGVWESLKDMFLPEEDQHVYAEGLRRGGFVVSVQTSEAQYERALEILDHDGAVDLDQREASWRSEGWTGYASEATAVDTGLTSNVAAPATVRSSATTAQTAGAPATSRDEVIPVYEEQLRVGRRDVNHGRVRIRSYVVEAPVSDQISLHAESVQIERHAVNRAVSATDALFHDRVIEAEEHVEEAIVAKDVFVKEEISLRKTAEDQVRTISDTVRRTVIEINDDRKIADDSRGRITAEEQLLVDIEAWAGSRQAAEHWYKSIPVPAFGGITSAKMFSDGNGNAVREFVGGLLSGEYA